MDKKRWVSILAMLMFSMFACGIPLGRPGLTPTADLATAVEQTIEAQQFEATATALSQDGAATVTAEAQMIMATQTALSLQLTNAANSSSTTLQALAATSTSQALAATVEAFDTQATALAYAQTATAQALSIPPPSPPQPLPPQPIPGMTRISFSKGATSATITGQIRRGESLDFAIRALSGQTMMTSVYSPNSNVYLGIVGLTDGIPLIRTVASATTFSGVLPGTQDYRITLFAPDQKSSFTLQVIIPARIKFASGAISAQVPGFLKGGEVNYYLLRANAGQLMTAKILSPHSDIFLTIYGIEDGSPLVRSVMGQTSWTGSLPGTQDYMIEAVSTGANAEYTLEVIVH